MRNQAPALWSQHASLLAGGCPRAAAESEHPKSCRSRMGWSPSARSLCPVPPASAAMAPVRGAAGATPESGEQP